MKSVHFLRNIHLFKEFTINELGDIAHILQERDYKKGEVVFLAEETDEFMYIVKYGEVKVIQSSKDGRENILAIHHSGETFGELALLDGKTSPATVMAKEDCKIIVVSRTDFYKILLKNQKIVDSLLDILCQKLRESWNIIQALKFDDAETRLKFILAQLAHSDGTSKPNGILINTKITHQELAEMAGTSRETISRLISKLQRKRILRVTSHRCLLLDHPYWKEP